MNKVYLKHALLVLLSLAFFNRAWSQGRCDTLNLPASVHACKFDTMTLNPNVKGPYPIVISTWTPATGLSDATSLTPFLTLGSSSITYTLQTYAVKPPQLDTNGNFSMGNSKFTSGYTYISSGPISSGKYGIVTDPTTMLGSYPLIGDHTSGTGNMMVVQGSTSAADNFWCQTINGITPFTQYYFSCYVALMDTTPGIKLTINGVPISTYVVTTPLGSWAKFSAVWQSNSSISANICLSDTTTSASGNAFAIDDITFNELCVNTASIKVNVSQFAPAISVVKPSCSKTINVTGSDSVNANLTSYNWSFGDGNTDTGTHATHTYIDTGGYKVTLIEKDSYGCSDSSHTNIDINTSINTVKAFGDTTICKGTYVQLSAIGAKKYSWSPTDSLSDSTISNPVAHPSISSYYIVTGTDSNGCTGSDTVIINLFPAPKLTITPGKPVITCENSSVQLYVTGARKFIWQPGTLMDSNTSSHPIAMPPTTTTFYVLGSDGKGCESYDSIKVVVLRDSVYMPNAFTPDGDGLNDIIFPTPYCDFIFGSFNVYNRYGNLMFSTTKYRDGWDGKFNGQPQPTDVYVYYITGFRIDRTPVLIKGNITLLR